jgi:hypothetical protein
MVSKIRRARREVILERLIGGDAAELVEPKRNARATERALSF